MLWFILYWAVNCSTSYHSFRWSICSWNMYIFAMAEILVLNKLYFSTEVNWKKKVCPKKWIVRNLVTSSVSSVLCVSSVCVKFEKVGGILQKPVGSLNIPWSMAKKVGIKPHSCILSFGHCWPNFRQKSTSWPKIG